MTATETTLKTWEVILPRDLQEYVEEMIEKKQFLNVHALMANALYAFRDVAEAGRIKHERLKADIQHAIEQADRGELFDADEVFDEIERDLLGVERNGK